MQSLAKLRDELTSGQEKLSSAVVTLDRELSELQQVCSGLEEEQVKLQKTLQSLEAAGEEVDPDEVANYLERFHYLHLCGSSLDSSYTAFPHDTGS